MPREAPRIIQAPVYSCSPTATLAMAAREMEVHNVGSLVVTDEDQKLVGIITDRDLALGLAHGQTAATTVEEVMSPRVVTIGVDASLDTAAATMDNRAVRRLPVVDVRGGPSA